MGERLKGEEKGEQEMKKKETCIKKKLFTRHNKQLQFVI